jgi:hypothetical protein
MELAIFSTFNNNGVEKKRKWDDITKEEDHISPIEDRTTIKACLAYYKMNVNDTLYIISSHWYVDPRRGAILNNFLRLNQWKSYVQWDGPSYLEVPV